MNKKSFIKPRKRKDMELWRLISEKIMNLDYVFAQHATARLQEKNITDLEVLEILENKDKRKRKRNKQKDIYTPGYQDWNYCIEGIDIDGNKIRIIISFDQTLMLIITVIRVNDKE